MYNIYVLWRKVHLAHGDVTIDQGLLRRWGSRPMIVKGCRHCWLLRMNVPPAPLPPQKKCLQHSENAELPRKTLVLHMSSKSCS